MIVVTAEDGTGWLLINQLLMASRYQIKFRKEYLSERRTQKGYYKTLSQQSVVSVVCLPWAHSL